MILTMGLAIAGCSKDPDPDSAPTLAPIVTTIPSTTTVDVATARPQLYEVQPGDTLTAIADAYSVPVEALLEANPEIASPDDIYAGRSIRIPPADGDVATTVLPTAVDQSVSTTSHVSTDAASAP